MNWVYNLWGGRTSTLPEKEIEIDQFVLIEGEPKVVLIKEEQKFVYDKLVKNLPVHYREQSLIASSVLESKLVNKMDLKTPSEQTEENAPYNKALTNQVQKSKRLFSRSLYFLDGSILGVRGKMARHEKVVLEQVISLPSQVFVDLTRWGEHAQVLLEGESHSLSFADDFPCVVIGNHRIPPRAILIIQKIRKFLNSEKFFSTFARMFTQGPFNDMIYSMTADIIDQWGAVLIPDQKMERVFHLINDNNTSAKKVVITVKGHFIAGCLRDRRVIEPRAGQILATFHGVTAMNLSTDEAFVNTAVEWLL